MASLTPLHLPQGLKDSLVLTIGNLISTAISAISLIVLARVLGPTRFGAFSVAFSITMLLAKVADFGFNLSTQKFFGNALANPLLTRQLLHYALKIKAIASLITLVLSMPVSLLLSRLLFGGEYLGLTFISIVLTIVIIYFDFLNLAFISLGQGITSALMMIIQSIVKVIIVGAIFVFHQVSEVTAYLVYGLSPITGLIYGFSKLKWVTPLKPLSKESIRPIWQLTRHTGILTLAMAAADQIDVLLVQGLTDTYQTGLYSAASRIALLLSVIAYSVGSVLNARVARYHDPHTLKIYLGKAYLFSLGSVLVSLLILPIARFMILFTSGPQYLSATPTLNWLIISGGLQIAAVTFTALFYSLNLPQYFTISGLLQVMILVVGNVVLVPFMGILGAGIARTLMRLGVLLITIVLAHQTLKRHHQLRLLDHWQAIGQLSRSLWPL